jgi:glutathione S-transferase
MKAIHKQVGMLQMPMLQTPSDEFLTDSTAIIQYFDSRFSPADPRRITPSPSSSAPHSCQAFLQHLLEDYADEHLWRPAMHYRWSHAPDASKNGRYLATTILSCYPILPLSLRQWFMTTRQRTKFVAGDGVTPSTRQAVEASYLVTLANLQLVLGERPFLCGGRPGSVDFAFFGSMYRHFYCDPTPRGIMDKRAPLVKQWVERMLDSRAGDLEGRMLFDGDVGGAWDGILRDVGASYLPYLKANASSFQKKGSETFDIELDGCKFVLPINRYRVWCLEKLQEKYGSLPEPAQRLLDLKLKETGCYDEDIWGGAKDVGTKQADRIASGFDPHNRLPFLTPATAWDQTHPTTVKPTSFWLHDGRAKL